MAEPRKQQPERNPQKPGQRKPNPDQEPRKQPNPQQEERREDADVPRRSEG